VSQREGRSSVCPSPRALDLLLIVRFCRREGKKNSPKQQFSALLQPRAQTLSAKGRENGRRANSERLSGTAGACQVAAGHFPLEQLIELRRLDPLPETARSSGYRTLATTSDYQIENLNDCGYVSDAKAIKKVSPKLFKQLKSGEKTITQVKRELQERKRESRRKKNTGGISATSDSGKSRDKARGPTLGKSCP
jgi:hypothetical protein